MTEPQPTGDAPNRQTDLVTKFHAEYGDSLMRARWSAEQTATMGWQSLYNGNMCDDRRLRCNVATQLRFVAEQLEDGTVEEEHLKALSDIRGDAKELLSKASHFDAQTVRPVVKPVNECEKIRERFLATARRHEAEAPLVEAGLEDVMKQAILQQPVPEWDADTGIVTVP